jgi:hypothetical protein
MNLLVRGAGQPADSGRDDLRSFLPPRDADPATGDVRTQQLLENLNQPDPEQSAWLQEVTSRGDDR